MQSEQDKANLRHQVKHQKKHYAAMHKRLGIWLTKEAREHLLGIQRHTGLNITHSVYFALRKGLVVARVASPDRCYVVPPEPAQPAHRRLTKTAWRAKRRDLIERLGITV